MTLVSVHAFGLADPGGGPRILRALFADPPMPVLSVTTQPRVPPRPSGYDQRHMMLRPPLGRLERTRLSGWGQPLDVALCSLLRARLQRVLSARKAAAVHAVAHSVEFWPALGAARSAGLPFFLTVHDDLAYNLGGSLMSRTSLARLAAAWCEADHRFAISQALGDEYCARYGARPFTIVTDGLDSRSLQEPRPPAGLRVYFAGLFHRGYMPNVPPFVAALERLRMSDQGGEVSLTCRCGELPVALDGHVGVRVLPFADETVVQDDLTRADLLYLPLPFDPALSGLVDFSLSTKLITYLGSGLPIVYHGPARGAAHELLVRHDAAILVTSQDPAVIAAAITCGLGRCEEIVARAQRLARDEFLLGAQRQRFWQPILDATR